MSITLIVGLGNPGPRYVATRHNAGFWLIDQFVLPNQFRYEAKFFGAIGRVELPGCSVWLLKPGTFMNRSGQSVLALANYYRIPVEQILVVHDDLDFPPGTVRLKLGGGDGKHNGLKDIIAQLGSHQFLRLRIGIGHPGRGASVSNYVLSEPNSVDQLAIENSITAALAVMPLIIRGELDKAMQQLHTQSE
ncbi:peptidyl-tRNA hydrolase [Thioploca ingrica]|uniref:Peptidyl-tRNA hydrolase n=1 Tax=Thioploca ingrica TaxID=40754 RepID=A0A090AEY1_9GAMM|nr:peptidyl-tRNA hydrolase [Thioploca ingrica]